MKREYVKPFAEKIEFDYQNQIVASNGKHFCNGSRGENYSDCVDNVVWNN